MDGVVLIGMYSKRNLAFSVGRGTILSCGTILLDPQILDEVDAAARDALERFAGDEDLRRRIPERPGNLDMVVLAGGPAGRARELRRAGEAVPAPPEGRDTLRRYVWHEHVLAPDGCRL